MSPAIVFFDGVCGLCNRFIDWLLVHDVEHNLRYSPLQGETARRLLFQGARPARFDSMVFWQDGRVLTKSDAVLAAVHELGGHWRLCSVLRFVPRFMRDGLYDLIANNRYQLFGRRDSCRLPTLEERALFLD